MGLLDLPTELLQLIFNDVNDSTLNDLSFVSRRLHDIALGLYLARLRVPIDPSVVIDIGHPTKFQVLRRALFINSAKDLDCTLPVGTDRIQLGQLRGLIRLVRRMSRLSAITVWVQVHVPFSESDPWTQTFMELLNAVAETPCTRFSVWGMTESRPLIEIDVNELRSSPIPPTPAKFPESPAPVLSRVAEEECAARPAATFNSLEKSSKLQGRKPSAAEKVEQNVVGQGNALTHPITPHPIVTLQRLDLDMSSFLRPPLLSWTIRTISMSSNSIATLRLGPLRLSTRSWAAFMEFLSLPSLYQLNIASRRISVTDISKFLRRHTHIARLSIDDNREIALTREFGQVEVVEQVMQLSLPCLIAMFVTCDSIIRLLEANHLHAPRLSYVVVNFSQLRSEIYSKMDYALKLLGQTFHPSCGTTTCFCLQIYGELPWAHWLRRDSSERVENSLHCVTTLSISDASLPHETMDLLPQWLALFPALKGVRFNNCFVITSESDGKRFRRFIQRLREECPKMDYLEMPQARWESLFDVGVHWAVRHGLYFVDLKKGDAFLATSDFNSDMGHGMMQKCMNEFRQAFSIIYGEDCIRR